MNPFFEVREEEIKTAEAGLLVPRKAIINAETDKVISVVGENYKVIKNQDLVKNFEDYLEGTDVPFTRMTANNLGKRGQRFTAKYKFPEIEANFGMHKTAFGEVPDNVQLLMQLHNSYDGSAKWGFEIGGYRLVCLNGMRSFEKLFRFAAMHTTNSKDEYDNQFIVSFQAAKDLFENKLVTSWNNLVATNFDHARALQVLKGLELSQMYEKEIQKMYDLRINNLKTMWDFYNMITYFSTHIVEQRNLALSREISANGMRLINETA